VNRSEGLLVRPLERSPWRVVGIVALGFMLGALLTKLSVLFIPEGPFREFFTTSVSASIGPVSVDLLVVALTLGPLAINVNLFSIAGVLAVAYVARLML
jgi:hypothetical protein